MKENFSFLKASFNADPNIGLYSFATDSYCLSGLDLNKKLKIKIEKLLKVNMRFCSIAGTEFAGFFTAGNSNGLILPKITEKIEIQKLKKLFPELNITVLYTKHTALGNLILCNNNGALISDKLKSKKKKIQDCLGVEVETGKIANMEIVGSNAISSNIGCLCHREASEQELEKIERLLKVKVDIGTVNYGSPFIRSGLIVNSNAVITSVNTTGPELGRISEVFM